MLKKILVLIFSFFVILVMSAPTAFAVENPLSKPNNLFGVHILFPSEVDQAASLVNSNGGDWGYVVIPIQETDLDLQKWQTFMDNCKQKHLIPIIRLATEGDYFDTTAWRTPEDADILDFANFLNSLQWPTLNKYVIVFNEVNRADEFGGKVDPATYARLLSYAATVFKSMDSNFFIISAGMDNASANTSFSMNEYDYFRAMNQAIPGIFNQVDGIASHSYPNPGFSQPPTVLNSESIDSFQFERSLIESMSSKQLPVFITETGWPTNVVEADTTGKYYQKAFSSVWKDPNLVTVAPFLLQAQGGPFLPFSLLSSTNSQTPAYTALMNMPKIKGTPSLSITVLGDQIARSANLPTENFNNVSNNVPTTEVSHSARQFFKWLLGI